MSVDDEPASWDTGNRLAHGLGQGEHGVVDIVIRH
jgi:hypothetical protein